MGNSTIPDSYEQLRPIQGQIKQVDQAEIRNRAAAILRAVVDGKRVSSKDIHVLAEMVLASRSVVLAHAVLQAEPEFVIARAIELAANLISQDYECTGEADDDHESDSEAVISKGTRK